MTVHRRGLIRILAVALLPAILAIAAGCSASDPQNTFAPSGDVAKEINDLFFPIGWLTVVIFFLVEGLLIYILIRFRHRPGAALPKQTHGNTRLELAWTAAPAALMAVIAIPVVMTIFSIAEPPKGEKTLNVTVTASQWFWNYEYSDLGVVTSNEMHIPLDTPVVLTLKSNDVIHSFWVPKLGGKLDIVPGHTNTMWFNATEPGNYSGQCVEYCGTSHALMRFRVIAESQADFDTWVQAQKQPATFPSDLSARGGQQKFLATCAVCHTVSGTDAKGQVGPNLTHLASRGTIAAGIMDRTDENLATWLRDPTAVKPGSLMPNLGLTDDEIKDLVTYLNTLK